ncbi:uncharacterized protein LOC131218247 isoform X2 [Magnolia sinica]|uniref:uncharacterized protein LOC131218247 isoform X2 n=1 Tax=Magnolia sinica TaxID=86752 RepID=UPI002658A937|nr:uncharacterized protein LOC131218247 isoform X2 [Magnolia sinica]
MEEMCKIQAVHQVGPYLLMPQLKNQASPLLGGSPKARDLHPTNSVQQDPFRSFSVLRTSYIFTSWEDASIKQNLSNREPAETIRWRSPATQGRGGNRSYSSHYISYGTFGQVLECWDR